MSDVQDVLFLLFIIMYIAFSLQISYLVVTWTCACVIVRTLVIPRLERTLIPKRISKYHLRHLPKCEKVRVRSLYIIEYVKSSVAARHDIRDIDENQTCSEKHNATLMIYECSFINVILLSKNVYFFQCFFANQFVSRSLPSSLKKNCSIRINSRNEHKRTNCWSVTHQDGSSRIGILDKKRRTIR